MKLEDLIKQFPWANRPTIRVYTDKFDQQEWEIMHRAGIPDFLVSGILDDLLIAALFDSIHALSKHPEIVQLMQAGQSSFENIVTTQIEQVKNAASQQTLARSTDVLNWLGPILAQHIEQEVTSFNMMNNIVQVLSSRKVRALLACEPIILRELSLIPPALAKLKGQDARVLLLRKEITLQQLLELATELSEPIGRKLPDWIENNIELKHLANQFSDIQLDELEKLLNENIRRDGEMKNSFLRAILLHCENIKQPIQTFSSSEAFKSLVLPLQKDFLGFATSFNASTKSIEPSLAHSVEGDVAKLAAALSEADLISNASAFKKQSRDEPKQYIVQLGFSTDIVEELEIRCRELSSDIFKAMASIFENGINAQQSSERLQDLWKEEMRVDGRSPQEYLIYLDQMCPDNDNLGKKAHVALTTFFIQAEALIRAATTQLSATSNGAKPAFDGRSTSPQDDAQMVSPADATSFGVARFPTEEELSAMPEEDIQGLTRLTGLHPCFWLKAETFKKRSVDEDKQYLIGLGFKPELFDTLLKITQADGLLDLVKSVAWVFWLSDNIEQRLEILKESWRDKVYLSKFEGLANQNASPSEFLVYLDTMYTLEDFQRDWGDSDNGSYERAKENWMGLATYFSHAEELIRAANPQLSVTKAAARDWDDSGSYEGSLPQDAPQRFFSAAVAVTTKPTKTVDNTFSCS